MITFLHNFVPQPLALSIGFLNIHWYGLFAVAGILAGLAVVWRIGKTRGITADEIFDLAFYIIIFGILGARIYSVFLDWPYYLQNPMQIVAVWNGGLAIHGAIIGGALALLVYARKNQQSFWRWADLIAVSLPLGQAIGRFGNYFNQELFGAPTNLPWGIPIEPALRPSQFSAEQYFHPTFLYEAILNIVNFLVLLWVFRKWASGQVGKWASGVVALVYLINYSVIRILMEFLRVDTAPEVSGIRWPVVVSIAIIIASVVGLAGLSRKAKRVVV